ncbi:protein Spindly-B [Eurosta solidaginis]|uniref:protein Spindly-B n=1 Tax=Eurosta solidaginis TaxID=178769 RepID=UPI003530D15A
MEDDFEIEFMSLPLEDLQDYYGKLFERYRQMRDDAEEDTQRIYELKRTLETAYAAQNYLSQEIEDLMQTLASIENESKGQTKAQTELEDLRRQHHTLTTDYTTLQQDYAAMAAENAELRKQLETAKSEKRLSTSSIIDAGTEELTKRISILEGENFSLMQKLEEFQDNVVKQTMALAERESNIEILRDQVTCLEENIRSKRDDLNEKTTLLESTQEQLAESNARLALLETKPEGVDRKGNSLFAEVDDQRQAMKKLLAAQKKSYMDMKKVFHDSQSEIRRLKRENVAMHTELRECSSIFCAADRTYQSKLNERIHQLLNQVEELEKQLNVTQGRLRDLASDKGVAWLDSMLSFCKQETDDLKKQLHAVRLKKADLEEQLRDVQQEMTRWRFEALKTRCVLLDRENILNENNIKFKAINAMEFNISQSEQDAARPRIVHASPVTLQVNTPIEKRYEIPGTPLSATPTADTSILIITPTTSMISPAATVKQDEPEKENETPEATPTLETNLKMIYKKNIDEPKQNQANGMSPVPVVHDKPTPDENTTTPLHERTADNALKNEQVMLPPQNSKKVPPASDVQPGRSILSRRRDVFMDSTENSEKTVQFCSQDPIVHNISGNVIMGQDTSTTTDATNTEPQPKAYIKQIRTKSNIIVRHIHLPSKRKPT